MIQRDAPALAPANTTVVAAAAIVRVIAQPGQKRIHRRDTETPGKERFTSAPSVLSGFAFDFLSYSASRRLGGKFLLGPLREPCLIRPLVPNDLLLVLQRQRGDVTGNSRLLPHRGRRDHLLLPQNRLDKVPEV